MKTEIEKHVTPLRDAVILLNSMLPACDLTDAEIELVNTSDDENPEQPVVDNGAGGNREDVIPDVISGSIQFDVQPVNSL